MEMDVTVEKSIWGVYEKLKSEGISVDILVNNAALNPKVEGTKGGFCKSKLEDISLERWDQELRVGLTGAFFCSQFSG